MTTESKPKRSLRRRILIWTAIALGLATVFPGCILFFLPDIVSSQWFRELVEERASEATRRSVHIGALDWRWSDGIALDALRVEDDPIFSDDPLIAVNEIRFDIAYGEILNGRLDFLFSLDGLTARVIRDKTGKTNVENWLSELEAASPEKEGEAPVDSEKPPPSLPLDVKAAVDLTHISIFIDDRLAGKRYEVRDAAVHLDAPSVLREPITLKASTRLEPEDESVLDFHLQGALRDLMDPDGVLAVDRMAFELSGGLPGADFTAKGDLATHQIRCGVSADLASVSDISRILAPPEAGLPDIAGSLEFVADINGDPEETLAFDIHLAIRDLVVSGGPVPYGAIGPLAIHVAETGELDVGKGELSKHSGEFKIQEKSVARWEGAASGLTPPPGAEESTIDITLDLAAEIHPPEILDLLAPLTPPDAPLPRVDGILEIKAGLAGNPLETISFETRVTGRDLVVSGGPVQHGEIGPLVFAFAEKGEVNTAKGVLSGHTGEFRIQEKSGFRWSGSASGFIRESGAEGIKPEIELTAAAEIDPSEMIKLLAPLAPPDAPLPDVAGKIEIETNLSGKPLETITFDTRVTGADLVVSGGPISHGAVGPLNFRFSEKGRMNTEKGELSEHSGEFRIRENSGFRWSGAVTGLIQPPGEEIKEIGIELTMTSRVDPSEIRSLIAPLAPPDVDLPEIAGDIEIETDLRGNPSQTISFDVRAAGADLIVSGGPLEDALIGPINVRFSEKGELDADKGDLGAHSGEFRFQEKTSVRWRGAVTGVIQPPGAEKKDMEIELNLTSEIDPSEILTFAAPLAPSPGGLPDIAGDLRFTADVSGAPLKTISFDVRLTGEELVVSGGPVKEGVVGPMNFIFSEKGELDADKGDLSRHSGEFRFLAKTGARWSGAVTGLIRKPGAGEKETDLSLNLASEINPSELLKLLAPMASASTPLPDVAGGIEFKADVTGDPFHVLSFDSRLTGEGLVVSGGPIEDKTLGPMDFTLSNSGAFDGRGETLSIRNGEFGFLDNSRLRYEVVAADVNGAAPELDIRFSPISLDLGEIFNRIKAFLPENLPLRLLDDKGTPVFNVKALAIRGPLSTGVGNVRLEEMGVEIPGLRLKTDALDLTIRDLAVNVPDVQSEIRNFFPETVDVASSLSIGETTVRGDAEATIRDLAIPRFALQIRDARPSERAPFGLTSRFAMDEALTVGELNVPKVVSAKGIRQSAAVEVTLPSNAPAVIAVNKMDVTLPDLVVETPEDGPRRTNSRLTAAISEIKIKRMDPMDVDVTGARALVALDDILEVNLEASAKESGAAGVAAKGEARLNLTRLSEEIPPRLFPPETLSGEARMGWSVRAKLPAPGELDRLARLTNLDMGRDLAFLDEATLSLDLKEVGLSMKTEPDRRVSFASASAGPLLSYSYNGKERKGDFSGGISIRGLEESPADRIDTPLDIDIVFSGTHDDLETVSFSESMTAAPLNVKQTLRASVHGMDRVLRRGLDMPASSLLTHVGGSISGGVDIRGDGDLSMLADGVNLRENLTAGMEMQVDPGRRIRAAIHAHSPGVDYTQKGLVELSRARVNLDLEKEYHVIIGDGPGKEASAARAALPLSERVLRPDAPPRGRPGESGSRRWLSPGIRARDNTRQGISFDRARLETGPLPVEIERSLVNFDLRNGLPDVDHFSIDLLGGTVIGSFEVQKVEESYFVHIQLAFSGIDAAALFPGTRPLEEDSEITGRLLIQLPLYTELPALIRTARFDLDFSHIGPRALERLLHALDPHESDEAIVSQRRILRTGSPRWIRISMKDGSLSIAGEVTVSGSVIAIPRVERLNLANLANLEKYEKHLAALKPAIRALNILSANVLRINENGDQFRFETRE